jgi:hypothetical protein
MLDCDGRTTRYPRACAAWPDVAKGRASRAPHDPDIRRVGVGTRRNGTRWDVDRVYLIRSSKVQAHPPMSDRGPVAPVHRGFGRATSRPFTAVAHTRRAGCAGSSDNQRVVPTWLRGQSVSPRLSFHRVCPEVSVRIGPFCRGAASCGTATRRLPCARRRVRRDEAPRWPARTSTWPASRGRWAGRGDHGGQGLRRARCRAAVGCSADRGWCTDLGHGCGALLDSGR